MHVTPLSGALGAEIAGVDLRALDDEGFEALRRVFLDRSVVVVRGQDLTPDDHVAFARRWGPINVNRFFKPTDAHPEVAVVLKEADQALNIGGDWHTDQSYDEAPAMGSLLYAVETPSAGGDTLFCSMHAAYTSMSAGMQATLSALSAWHSSRHAFGGDQEGSEAHKDGRLGNNAAATQDARHPVVIAHPETGRPTIYLNTDFATHFDGWTPAESRPLMRQIEEIATLHEHTCRIRWAPGDLAIWDNRAVMHKAINDYHGQRRLMHRVTVEGAPLSAYRP